VKRGGWGSKIGESGVRSGRAERASTRARDLSTGYPQVIPVELSTGYPQLIAMHYWH